MAVAFELVHTMSLIHDDLPAMDDAPTRRGRPTLHCAYDDATAILAGDAILVRAFEILSESALDPGTALAIIRELSGAVGLRGLAAGQEMDLRMRRNPGSVTAVERVHAMKTASLFRAACRCGARVVDADPRIVDLLGDFGQAFGSAFQVADDLLDGTGCAEALGKPVHQDRRHQGSGLLLASGTEDATLGRVDFFLERAMATLAPLGEKADPLRDIARGFPAMVAAHRVAVDQDRSSTRTIQNSCDNCP